MSEVLKAREAEKGLVARTDPDKPMSPRQEYKLA